MRLRALLQNFIKQYKLVGIRLFSKGGKGRRLEEKEGCTLTCTDFRLFSPLSFTPLFMPKLIKRIIVLVDNYS